jgi:hypothetical protein
VRSPLLAGILGPWMVNGGIIVGAMMRSAVIGESSTRSNAMAKGRTNSLAAALISTPSNLWAERLNQQAWSISLGARSADPAKIVYDWQITAECATDDAGPLVRIRTPRYRMTDGALVNGGLHDAIRENIVSRFTHGIGEAGALEGLLCRRSLSSFSIPTREATGQPAGFEAVTELTPDEVRDLLPRLGFPVLGTAPGRWSWRLGLPPPGPAGRAEITLTDLGAQRRVSGVIEIGHTGHLIADLTAEQSATTFVTRLRNLIRREDPDVQWQPTGTAAADMGGQRP